MTVRDEQCLSALNCGEWFAFLLAQRVLQHVVTLPLLVASPPCSSATHAPWSLPWQAPAALPIRRRQLHGCERR